MSKKIKLHLSDGTSIDLTPGEFKTFEDATGEFDHRISFKPCQCKDMENGEYLVIDYKDRLECSFCGKIISEK